MNDVIKYWDDNLVAVHIGTEINWVHSYIEENNIEKISFIDIGGNVGKFFDELSKKYTIDRCIIVEPSKRLYDYMCDKFKNNPQVTVHNFGISKENGMFQFDDSGIDYWTEHGIDNSMNLGIFQMRNNSGETQFFTIDYFLENYNTIDPKKITFIKIDTESRDLYIIEGLKKYLQKHQIRPLILFENNFHADMTLDEAQTIVNDFCGFFGYESTDLSYGGDKCLIPIKNLVKEKKTEKKYVMNSVNMEQIFSSIYNNCSWGNNGNDKYSGSSGDGSSAEYNIDYIDFVKKFITENNIKSVSDGGCGDWRLGSELYYNLDIEYNGYDVYFDLITYLKTEYNKPNFNFIHLDIFGKREDIKSSDLLIVKDVVQHWDDPTTEEFVEWAIKSNKFKFILINNCVDGRNGMTQVGSNGGWRGLSSDHPIFNSRGFKPVLKYHTKEVMLYTSNTLTTSNTSNTLSIKKIYEIINNFKIDKKFWSYTNLSGEDYENRSKAGPYIKTTIKIAKLLGLSNFVEIGSTRFAVSQKCIDYYNKENEAFKSPACCTDGHCGFFFAREGFTVNTVDIDINCQTQIIWSYGNIGESFPENVIMHIPKDGIEFLNECKDKIDILFLDGWDVGTPEYAEKHLEAYLAAKDKLSDVHLILIDDTDFTSKYGGKDKVLSPYLINNGYIPLFNGRQTLFINTLNVTINEVLDENQIFNKELDENLTDFPNVVLSLTTTPNRLSEVRERWGVKPVIERLLSLSYPNYEIHFNIPYINHKTQQEYIIPEWLIEYEKTNKKLKIFRCNDYGSITKIVPTLMRIENPESIIITIDDDLNYNDGFIEYHLNKRKIYPNSVLGFAGIGSIDNSCHFCTTLKKDTRVKIIEGYKTVSYLRKFFKQDFFNDFVGQSWSDDILLSAYLGKENIEKIVMNYNLDTVFNPVVESFPVINSIPNDKSGCSLYREQSVSDNSEKYYKLGFLEK